MGVSDRRAKRADLSIPVTSQHFAKTVSHITNLSTHGAFISCQNPLNIGDSLTIGFSLPNQTKVIELNGVIVWNRSEGDNPGMGIEFQGLSESNFDRLLKFIEELYG